MSIHLLSSSLASVLIYQVKVYHSSRALQASTYRFAITHCHFHLQQLQIICPYEHHRKSTWDYKSHSKTWCWPLASLNITSEFWWSKKAVQRQIWKSWEELWWTLLCMLLNRHCSYMLTVSHHKNLQNPFLHIQTSSSQVRISWWLLRTPKLLRKQNRSMPMKPAFNVISSRRWKINHNKMQRICSL